MYNIEIYLKEMKNEKYIFGFCFVIFSWLRERSKDKSLLYGAFRRSKNKSTRVQKAEKLNETQRLDCQNANSAILSSGKNDWEGKSRPDIYQKF